MKLIGYLIIVAALVAGTISTGSAYLVSLALDDETLNNLTLSAPAGIIPPPVGLSDEQLQDRDALKDQVDQVQELLSELDQANTNTLRIPPREPLEPETPIVVDKQDTGQKTLTARETRDPIARSGDVLIPELALLLRDNNVTHVRVKSFSFLRWPQNWLFVLAVIGLLGGSALVRAATKAATNNTQPTSTAAARSGEDIIADVSQRLRDLQASLDTQDNQSNRLHAIIEHIGEIQGVDVPAFAADRPALVARLGLGRYAELMDHFAAMERQLNRAWSAAADSYEQESRSALEAAQPHLAATIERLKHA